nr:nuclear pore complex protein NUP107-like [Tanacetum cinerariifolium]
MIEPKPRTYTANKNGENDGFGPNKHPDGGILAAVIAAGDLARFQASVTKGILRVEAWYSGSDGSLGNPATYILSRSQNSFFGVCRESGNAHESHDELIKLVVNSETEILHLFSQNQLQIIETVTYKSEMRDLGETLLYIKTLGAYEFKDKGDEYYENLAISSF